MSDHSTLNMIGVNELSPSQRLMPGCNYPFSRDWGLEYIKCGRVSCICNDKHGKCIIPSCCEIGEDGYCKNFKLKEHK